MGKSWLLIAFIIVGLTGYYWGRDANQRAVLQVALQEQRKEMPLVLDQRVKTANCFVSSGRPDHACTPGSIFPNIMIDQVCTPGYTQTVRKVSVSLKKQIYREYGVSYPPPFGSYEADHFIPLALGGNNDIANLWPESAGPQPGFREKDLVENYLHEKVCAGEMTIPSAQRAISTDWTAVYNRLTPEEIGRLKQNYRSWSQTGD